METSFVDESEALSANADLSEPFQLGNSQAWPVKLFNVNPFFSHRRQGVPDLSSARRLALIKPVFALGPSLWLAVVVAAGLTL